MSNTEKTVVGENIPCRLISQGRVTIPANVRDKLEQSGIEKGDFLLIDVKPIEGSLE